MEGNSTTELPIIGVGTVLEWSNGDTSEVVSLYFNEDGIPQVRLEEYHSGDDDPYRKITVTYDDTTSRISADGAEAVEEAAERDRIDTLL